MSTTFKGTDFSEIGQVLNVKHNGDVTTFNSNSWKQMSTHLRAQKLELTIFKTERMKHILTLTPAMSSLVVAFSYISRRSTGW